MKKLKPSQHKLFPYPLVSIMNACSPAERKLQLYLRTYTHTLSLISTTSVACIIVCVLAAVVILTVKGAERIMRTEIQDIIYPCHPYIESLP